MYTLSCSWVSIFRSYAPSTAPCLLGFGSLELFIGFLKDKARKVLIEEENIASYDADFLLEGYPVIHEPLVAAVRQWFEDRTISDVSVEGVSIRQLMKNRPYHFLTAVKALNRLLDDTISTKEKDILKETLASPVHYS